jgi:hypothetical protein
VNCAECGFSYELVQPDAVAGRLRALRWPEATERDLGWVGRHAVHEGEHHLMDVRRVLAATA